MDTYRIIIFKSLSLIPAIFKVYWNNDTKEDEEKLENKIMTGLNGNAILFVDTKGKRRIYDRNIITKIFVKKI